MNSEERIKKFEFMCKVNPGETGRQMAWIQMMVDICDESCRRSGKKTLSQQIIEYQQAYLTAYLKEATKAAEYKRHMDRQRSMGKW
jgi:hypothetical protein